MKWIIPTTSISFKSLLTDEEINNIKKLAKENKLDWRNGWTLDTLIKNSWTTIIYFEFINDATIDSWVSLEPWQVFNFKTFLFDNLNLISEWWNWEIRFISH